MGSFDLHAEALKCRRKALEFIGKREASFLLRVAEQFDRLAEERRAGSPLEAALRATADERQIDACVDHGSTPRN